MAAVRESWRQAEAGGVKEGPSFIIHSFIIHSLTQHTLSNVHQEPGLMKDTENRRMGEKWAATLTRTQASKTEYQGSLLQMPEAPPN